MRVWLVAPLLALLFLSGCTGGPEGDGGGGSGGGFGGDGDGDGDGNGDGAGDGGIQYGPGDGTGNRTSDGRRTPATWLVVIRDGTFVNGTLTIQRDDRVMWVNDDGSVRHTATADDGSFDSGPLDHYDDPSFSRGFNRTGEFSYHCEMHPSMTGTVTVLDVHEERPPRDT